MQRKIISPPHPRRTPSLVCPLPSLFPIPNPLPLAPDRYPYPYPYPGLTTNLVAPVIPGYPQLYHNIRNQPKEKTIGTPDPPKKHHRPIITLIIP